MVSNASDFGERTSRERCSVMPTFIRDGVQLHYELDGSGPPVVLISGLSEHSNDPIAAGLRQCFAQNHTVLAVDNRGSGQTITPDEASFIIEDMADDIAAIVDHHKLGSVHTLGISMGGCIAMTLAIRHPETVCSQVVVVSLAQGNLGGRPWFLLDTLRALLDGHYSQEIINRFYSIMLFGESAFEDTDLIDAWLNAPADPLVQTHAGYLQQRDAVKHYDIRAYLPSITTPTFVMGSPEDVLAPLHFQEEIARLIPEAKTKWYPGGHMFMILPMHLESFVKDVEAFWNQHS